MIPADLPVKRQCMRDQIRDTLLQRILDGTYAPSERLIELNLAHEFQVSQTPVREALREQEAMGAVQSERYCGTRVRPANMKEMAEAYAMRAILEERAAQLIAPCPAELLADLTQTLAAMQDAAALRDISSYTLATVHFHRRIVEQSGNRLFLQIWDSLHAQARMHFVALRVAEDLPIYAQAHVPILDAFKANNGALAGELLKCLIDHLISRIDTSDSILPPNASNNTVLASQNKKTV